MNTNLYRAFVQQRLLAVSLYRSSYCNLCNSIQQTGSDQLSPPPENATLSSSVFQEPIILETDTTFVKKTTEDPRQAWIESLASPIEPPVGLMTLHPDIFGFIPRLDIIHQNLVWQLKYKDINFNHARLPVEMRGPGKGYGPKPWPQKGTGRARHGSTKGPQWVGGGTVHGPRRFTTKFFMLPFNLRLLGLVSTLSCKFAQDDLKIVSSLDLPSEEGSYLESVVDERLWGDSVLFVDKDDLMPTNITCATGQVPQFNLLPLYGLNVHSMLKHHTLVMTVAAVELVQERLLTHLRNPMFRLHK